MYFFLGGDAFQNLMFTKFSHGFSYGFFKPIGQKWCPCTHGLSSNLLFDSASCHHSLGTVVPHMNAAGFSHNSHRKHTSIYTRSFKVMQGNSDQKRTDLYILLPCILHILIGYTHENHELHDLLPVPPCSLDEAHWVELLHSPTHLHPCSS